jgi:hypothetical protein
MHIFSDIHIYINIFSERVEVNLTGGRDLTEVRWYLEMRSLCPLLFLIKELNPTNPEKEFPTAVVSCRY